MHRFFEGVCIFQKNFAFYAKEVTITAVEYLAV